MEGKSEKPQPSRRFGLNPEASKRIGREIEQSLNPNQKPQGKSIFDALDNFDEKIGLLRDSVSESEKARQEAEKRALEAETRAKQTQQSLFTDSQTGLFNRYFYNQEIARTFDPERDDGNLGIVYIDLNFLKKTNDTYGHQVGDKLIDQVSKILKKIFRRGDILVHTENDTQTDSQEPPNNFAGRIGGDEFIALCRNTVGNSNFKTGFIDSISGRLKQELDLYNQNRKHDELPLSFSFGIAVYDKEIDSGKIESTQTRAEELMYQQKKAMRAERE